MERARTVLRCVLRLLADQRIRFSMRKRLGQDEDCFSRSLDDLIDACLLEMSAAQTAADGMDRKAASEERVDGQSTAEAESHLHADSELTTSRYYVGADQSERESADWTQHAPQVDKEMPTETQEKGGTDSSSVRTTLLSGSDLYWDAPIDWDRWLADHPTLQDAEPWGTTAMSRRATESATPVAAQEPAKFPVSLEHVSSDDAAELRRALLQMVRDTSACDQEGAPVKRVAIKPRHKVVDTRATISQSLYTAGLLYKWYYEPGPATDEECSEPVPIVFIGDVSGSMGRYVALVAWLLTALQDVAVVDSYLFSDAPTYATPLFLYDNFSDQLVALAQGVKSWQYGTRLCLALERIRDDQVVGQHSVVVLCTDGGFSLANGDWERTVESWLSLVREAQSVTILTPSKTFARDAGDCAAALWDVERQPRPGHTILASAQEQKVARFGLLARYAREVRLCASSADFLAFVSQWLLKLRENA